MRRPGHVAHLDLYGNQLTGIVPPELANLGSLQFLFLDQNGLTGSIPPELGSLGSLQSLDLGFNQLSGSIPPELGNLGTLFYLILGFNQLTGGIPPELGNLGSLVYLMLDYNLLTGSIPPELSNLGSLQYLNLSVNGLTGSIPPELGNVGSLQDLWLAGNQLTGSIPPELGNLGSLQSLDLRFNQLTGSIPPELGNLGSLRYLALDTNQLTGALPLNLTGLTLDRFWFYGTDLCVPADSAFQAWLASIPDVKGTEVTCPEGAPPVVLVHGWKGQPGSGGSQTCPSAATRVDPEQTHEYFGDLPRWLHDDLGFTDIYEVTLITSFGHTPRFEDNAEQCLAPQLWSVTGQGERQAIVIAHSMGGLVSRAYMEDPRLYKNDMARLITLGSPHVGINWGFLTKILLGSWKPEFLGAICSVDPGTCQLSTERVSLFNLSHNTRADNALYDLIGGSRTPWPQGWLLWPTDGPNDGVVGLSSATGQLWLPGLGEVATEVEGQFIEGYETDEVHAGYFREDPGDTRSCLRYLLGQGGAGGTCNLRPVEMAQAQALGPSIGYTLDVHGHVDGGQTVQHTLQVDTDGASLFYLSWMTGTVGLTLTDPTGTVIDPAYAAAHPETVSYVSGAASTATPPFASYAFTWTVPGVYTGTVMAGDVGTTGTDYLLFAAMETTRTLTVALDSVHYGCRGYRHPDGHVAGQRRCAGVERRDGDDRRNCRGHRGGHLQPLGRYDRHADPRRSGRRSLWSRV